MGRYWIKSIAILLLFSWPTLWAQEEELSLNPADASASVELLDVTGTEAESEEAKAAEANIEEAKTEETAVTDSPSAASVEPTANAEGPATPLTDESKDTETLPPPRPVSEAEADAPPQDAPAASTESAPTEVKDLELQGEPIIRGPIHEAFAEPVQHTPAPGMIIEKAPPSPVEEIPPTITDDRKNMEWIPGYWAWEPQTEDYVWVSGVWRKKPQGRVWVPGNWEQVENGYRWIAGAWLPAQDGEVVANKEILPLPPESLEEGPTGPAPSEEHFWVPGAWEQTPASQYAWRPGYWSRCHENWVWVPDHYIWDPAGCVFVPGYWDYTWERRGTLYAPCTFGSYGPGYRIRYRPTRIIDTDQWLLNLWVGPHSRCYYYGDYYNYMSLGYTPWYQYYGINRGFYDPFYSYYRWRFPATYGIGLYPYLNGLHLYYGSNAGLRPGVRFSPYRSYGNRGYVSLYGNVAGLNALANIPLSSRDRDRQGHRHDYLDDFYRGHGGGVGRGGGGGRSGDIVRDLRGDGRGGGDFQRRDRDGDRGLADVERTRSRDQRRNGVDTLGPVRRSPEGAAQQAVQTGRTPRDGSNLPSARGRDRNGSGRADAVTSAQSPANTTGPGGPVRTSQQPSGVTRQSQPGFSISGLKNARDRADVERQRAAMQSYQNNRGRGSQNQPRVSQPGPSQPSVMRSPSIPRQNAPPRIQSAPPAQGPSRSFQPAPRSSSPSVTRSGNSGPSRSAIQPRPQSTPQPRSQPSFSISGMKNAGSRAAVQQQRSAMQSRMQQRGGGGGGGGRRK